MECENNMEILVYKRGIGYVKTILCSANTAESVARDFVNKREYDGAVVCENNGITKALYGYCGM